MTDKVRTQLRELLKDASGATFEKLARLDQLRNNVNIYTGADKSVRRPEARELPWNVVLLCTVFGTSCAVWETSGRGSSGWVIQ